MEEFERRPCVRYLKTMDYDKWNVPGKKILFNIRLLYRCLTSTHEAFSQVLLQSGVISLQDNFLFVGLTQSKVDTVLFNYVSQVCTIILNHMYPVPRSSPIHFNVEVCISLVDL